MRMQWQHGWRQRQPRPLDWRERAVLIMLAIVAIPVALVLVTGLFLLALGFGVVGLATWLVAKFFWSRRAPPRYRSVISTHYVRVGEEPDQPAQRNPWTRR
jgi:hypothetical protein